MRRISIIGAFLSAAVCLAALAGGCGSAPPATSPPPPAEVSVSRPVPREVTDQLEYTGTTSALEAVDIRARVSGFLERVAVEPRAKVAPGQVLFTIDTRPFRNALARAEADLQLKEAQRTKAEYDADRVSELYQRGQASADEFSTVNSNRDALRAAVAAATAALEQSRLELNWCEVTAPITGRISRNLVDPGNIVQADATVLASITNDEDVFVYFNMSERDVLTVQARSREKLAAEGKSLDSRPELRELKLPVFIGLMTEDGHPHQGVLDYAAPALDPTTGTIQMRARMPNGDGILMAGLFVRVRVPISRPYEALTVAERALGSDQGQRYVYIVNNQNVVEYRPVQVGTLHQGLRVITAGLRPEERLIVTGIQRARPGLTVRPVDAPMPTHPEAAVPATTPASSPAPGGK